MYLMMSHFVEPLQLLSRDEHQEMVGSIQGNFERLASWLHQLWEVDFLSISLQTILALSKLTTNKSCESKGMIKTHKSNQILS
ncbi:hypothetical protein J0S82_007281 [Galemys pyrenaicus]|uniref:Uncharacterized protein n=1 Tax=Galemys pyrenaicus TaxID=202257 RepID=A0A8J6ARP9_GALPY|nr:hypothetical protein J0S82_007281 [Galemys pyrenaicus]